jgi:tetrahydromethanopterin S-methyltransferase subunit G
MLNHEDVSLQLEGGADDQTSVISTNDDRLSTKSEDMKNTNNEFVQEPSKSVGRIRFFLYMMIILLLVALLVIYS